MFNLDRKTFVSERYLDFLVFRLSRRPDSLVKRGYYAEAEKYFGETISLRIYPKLSETEQALVIQSVPVTLNYESDDGSSFPTRCFSVGS